MSRREGKCEGRTTGLTNGVHMKLLFLSEVEAGGIRSVEVSRVEIGRHTRGEGGLLGFK